MNDKNKDSNVNNLIGNVFNGTTNIVSGNNTVIGSKVKDVPKYEAVPIWRSPITMGVLTWLSIIIAVIQIFPFYNVVAPFINAIKNKDITSIHDNRLDVILCIVLFFIFILFLFLRRITKTQTRYPLFANYAISGFGKKITIEKIKISKCPLCGGTMKYYNKPLYNGIPGAEGTSKSTVCKRVPVFECKRNPEHCYRVDPAEDKLK